MTKNLPKTLMTGLTIGLVCLFLFGTWGVFSAFENSAEYCPTSLSSCGLGNWILGAEITVIASIGIIITAITGAKWFGMFDTSTAGGDQRLNRSS